MDAPLSLAKTKWSDFLNHLVTADNQTFEKEISSATAKLDAKAKSVYRAMFKSYKDGDSFHAINARIQSLPANYEGVVEAWNRVLGKYHDLQGTRAKPEFKNPVLTSEDIKHLNDNLIGIINTLYNKDQNRDYLSQLEVHFNETHEYLVDHPHDPRYHPFFRLCRKIYYTNPFFFPVNINLSFILSYRIEFNDFPCIAVPRYQYLVLRIDSEKLQGIPLTLRSYHICLEINGDHFKKFIKYCYEYPEKLETLKIEDLVDLLKVANTLGNDRQMEIVCGQLQKKLLSATQPELALSVDIFSLFKEIKSINSSHPQIIKLYDAFLRTIEKAFLHTEMTVDRLKFILAHALDYDDPVLTKMCTHVCNLHWVNTTMKVSDAMLLQDKNMVQILRQQFERLILITKIIDKAEDKSLSDHFRQIVVLVLTLNDEKICKELIDQLKNRFPEYTPQVATFEDADNDWELQAPRHAFALEFKFIPSFDILKNLMGLNITKIKFPRQNLDTLRLGRAFPIHYEYSDPQEYKPNFFEKLFLS
jgi:hypothetical protein